MYAIHLKQIEPSAKIVILGSCGGYNNLSEVLRISQDAHIISSKQVGTKTVNEPIVQAINSDLLEGKNIDWITMWKGLTENLKKIPLPRKDLMTISPRIKILALFS